MFILETFECPFQDTKIFGTFCESGSGRAKLNTKICLKHLTTTPETFINGPSIEY